MGDPEKGKILSDLVNLYYGRLFNGVQELNFTLYGTKDISSLDAAILMGEAIRLANEQLGIGDDNSPIDEGEEF